MAGVNPAVYGSRSEVDSFDVMGTSDMEPSSFEISVPSPSRSPQYNAYGDLIDREENRWLRDWYIRENNGRRRSLATRARTTARLNEFGDLVDRDENMFLRRWHVEHQGASTNKDTVRSDTSEEWARGRGALARVCAVVVLALPAWFSANAFLPEIMEEYGFDKKQGSLLTVAVNIGFVCATTLSTLVGLADRVTAARLVAMGAFFCGLCSGLTTIDLPLAAILLARFMTGAAIALVYPILVRYLSTWFSAFRGLAMGYLIGGLTLGVAVPNFVKAVLPFVPWRLGVLVPTGLAMIGGVLATGLIRGPNAPSTVTKVSCKNLRRVVGNCQWLLVTISYMAHSFELYGGWAWIGAFLLEYFDSQNLPGGSIAPLATFFVVAIGSFGCVAAGALADRFGRITIICICHLVSGLCIATLPFISSVAPAWLVLAIACLWGFLVNADSAQYSALITEVVDTDLVSTAVTLSIALGFVMTAIAIYVVPVLVENLGWKGAFLGLAAGPVLGLFAILCARMGRAAPTQEILAVEEMAAPGAITSAQISVTSQTIEGTDFATETLTQPRVRRRSLEGVDGANCETRQARTTL